MPRPLPLAVCCLISAILLTACEELLTQPTPVPGAAATAARAAATAIPPPVSKPSTVGPLAAAQPSPSPSPSPLTFEPTLEQSIEETRQALERALATPDLPGIEELLYEQVAVGTAGAGQVLSRDEAARWLRDHAGPEIRLTQMVLPSVVMLLSAVTEGWPQGDPIQTGRVRLNMHRFNAAGQQDELRGQWKIDVIVVE